MQDSAAVEDVFAEAQLAHVPRGKTGGRTMVVITLTGGDDALREALGDRVIAAAREALIPASPACASEAEFAVLPPPEPPPSVPAYEAPFLLAPLHAAS